MLGGFEYVFISDDVDIKRSRTPPVQTNPSVQIFDSSDDFKKLFWSKLSCDLDNPVQITR